MNDIHKIAAEILNPHKNPPRLDRQLAIESAIVRFSPDFHEAKEILDAIISALQQKYRSDWLVVVEEEAKALKIAFEEAEPIEPDPADEAYSLARELESNP